MRTPTTTETSNMTFCGNPDPDPENRDHSNSQWDEKECPLCGETIRRISYHLRNDECIR